MPNFSINNVVLVRYPFTDLTSAKVRPAVVVANFAGSPDHVMVPLTSRVTDLASGEFILADWTVPVCTSRLPSNAGFIRSMRA